MARLSGAYPLPVTRLARAALLAGLLALPMSPSRAGAEQAPLERLADVNPDNDGLVAPPDAIPDCEARLDAAKVQYQRAELPLTRSGRGAVCGAEQVVIYRQGPRGIRYGSSPLVSCGMALALASFEHLLADQALATFGKRVVSVQHGGTYSCRKMARFSALVSEHSYANAIDIKSFRLENGRVISVLRHFSAAPGKPEGEFLRTLASRLYDERIFSVVLTERFDALHRDHFHLDLARYRVDGTR